MRPKRLRVALQNERPYHLREVRQKVIHDHLRDRHQDVGQYYLREGRKNVRHDHLSDGHLNEPLLPKRGGVKM